MPFVHRLFAVSLLVVFSWSAAAESELSTDWIYRQTHQGGAVSIESLLAKFRPQSLERRLLAYHSESRQFADFLSPRVVVYNYDADFVMAFNGEPDSEGYQELEILEYDHEQARFHPHVFHFDPKGVAPPQYEANPTTCTRCHQKDIRPNWDPYFFWMGFYGSEDDDATRSGDNTPERRHYQDFLAKQEKEKAAKHGRYRFLPPHPVSRLNLDFNDRINCLNIKRMLRIFSSSPDSGALWKEMSKHEGARDLDPYAHLPEALTKRVPLSYSEMVQDTSSVIGLAIDRRLARQQQVLGSGPQSRGFNLTIPGDVDRETRTGYHARLATFWRYAFTIAGLPFEQVPTSRHPDYDLNTDAGANLDHLLKDAKIDPKTGRLVVSRVRQERSAHYPDYYVCPQFGKYRDLPRSSSASRPDEPIPD